MAERNRLRIGNGRGKISGSRSFPFRQTRMPAGAARAICFPSPEIATDSSSMKKRGEIRRYNTGQAGGEIRPRPPFRIFERGHFIAIGRNRDLTDRVRFLKVAFAPLCNDVVENDFSRFTTGGQMFVAAEQ